MTSKSSHGRRKVKGRETWPKLTGPTYADVYVFAMVYGTITKIKLNNES